MDQHLIAMFRRWFWLIVVATLIAMITTYWIAKDQPTIFEARSQLIVGPGIDSPSPDLNTLRAGSQLMQTYAELPTTVPFLQAIIDELQLKMTTDMLYDLIVLKANVETQILSITVRHGDPDVAIRVANKIAERLVDISPSSLDGRPKKLQEQARKQVDLVERSIADTEARIEQIEEELNTVKSSEAQSGIDEDVSGQFTNLETSLKQYEVRLQNASDLETKRQISSQLLKELLMNTSARIEKLETDINDAPNVSVRRLFIDQLSKERNHLSNLQRAIVETQRLIGGEPLEALIAATEVRVEELEVELLKPSAYGDRRRLIISELIEERDQLSQVQAIAVERERLVLDQIAQERNRLSETQQAEVERQAVLLDQLAQERKNLDNSRNTLALLYAQLQEATTNQVKIIEPASQAAPVGSSLWLIVFVGGAAGLVLSSIFILALEHLSDRIQTPTDLAQLTGGPVLGVISSHHSPLDSEGKSLIVEQQPNSKAAEDYRMVGTRLHFANGTTALRTLLLLNTQASEDESEVAANLAIILAQAGHRTILVDANLHQPGLNEYFNVRADPGLSEYLADPVEEPQLIPLDRYPGLSLLPAGSESANAFKLLASPRTVGLLNQLENYADIILISGPPLLSFAEGLLLASRMDGVVLIVDNDRTSREKVKIAMESLRSVGTQLIGSILNHKRPTPSLSLGKTIRQMNSLKGKISLESRNPLTMASPPPEEGKPFHKPLQ